MNPNAPRLDQHDPLPELKEIVRDAIEYGLIASETLQGFDQHVSILTDTELEEYLQRLWDDL